MTDDQVGKDPPAAAGPSGEGAAERASGTRLRSEPPVPRGAPCLRCKQPIEGEYYELNGRTTCPSCRAALDGNLALAAPLALASGAACTLVYYAIWDLWSVRFSLIAVIAGVIVGNVMRRFAGLGSRTLARWLAVSITYLSVVATYVHSVLEQAANAPLWAVLRASLLLPFGMIYEGSNVVTLVLLAFGLHEAWQFSRAPSVHVAGPFQAVEP